MRQREVVAALVVIAFLAISCLILNTFVQRSHFSTGSGGAVDTILSASQTGSGDRNLPGKAAGGNARPVRRKILAVIGVQVSSHLAQC